MAHPSVELRWESIEFRQVKQGLVLVFVGSVVEVRAGRELVGVLGCGVQRQRPDRRLELPHLPLHQVEDAVAAQWCREGFPA
jgi:hypothetical protein